MKLLTDCIDKDSGLNTRFSKSEKGKTFELRLESYKAFNCEVIDVDNCVFEGIEIRRSDWLFLLSDKNVTLKPKAYFVELKGSNIDDASEQLFNAIDRTKSQIHNFDIEARIVSNRGVQPEIQNSGFSKRVRKIIKKDIKFCKVHKGNNFTHVEKI